MTTSDSHEETAMLGTDKDDDVRQSHVTIMPEIDNSTGNDEEDRQSQGDNHAGDRQQRRRRRQTVAQRQQCLIKTRGHYANTPPPKTIPLSSPPFSSLPLFCSSDVFFLNDISNSTNQVINISTNQHVVVVFVGISQESS